MTALTPTPDPAPSAKTPYPPGFEYLPPRQQTIWLTYKDSGPHYSSPSLLAQMLGGKAQHYTRLIRTLVEHGYLISTGRQRQYRGKTIQEHRACLPEEYPGVTCTAPTQPRGNP